MSAITYKNYLIPPIFVGLSALAKGVYNDGLAMNDPILLMSVLTNMVSYDVALLVSDELLSRMVSSDGTENIASSGLQIVAEPLLQGLFNATLPALGLDRKIIRTARFSSNRNIRPLAAIDKETFLGRFTDGAVYNVLGTYLSSPLL